MKWVRLCAAAGLAAVLTTPAARAADPPAPSAVLKAVDACRAIGDDKARLACFDAAAAQLATAQAKGDVVVVDREQVQAARREAFGFNLPKLSVLGRLAAQVGDGGKSGEADEDSATFTIAGASQGGDGRWVVTMDNGMVWRQTNTTVGAMTIRKGDKAEVKKGMLGAYFMNVGRYKAIKVERAR
jgi:hypothetical protein